MKFSGVGVTDIGKRRSRNEDHLLVDDEIGLYIVADGIGGYAAGDVAARLAVERAARYIYERSHAIASLAGENGHEAKLSALAAEAVAEASRAVHRLGTANRKLAGMGCTLTMLLLGHRIAAMAHVGDSRLYLLRGGHVRQLSTDHNLANELVELGVIKARDAHKVRCGQLLTRSIGRRDQVIVEELVIDVQDRDRFVLCTDGFSNYLARSDDLRRLLTAGRFESSPRRLIDFANASGGQDNITAIVVQIDSVGSTAVDREMGTGAQAMILREGTSCGVRRYLTA